MIKITFSPRIFHAIIQVRGGGRRMFFCVTFNLFSDCGSYILFNCTKEWSGYGH